MNSTALIVNLKEVLVLVVSSLKIGIGNLNLAVINSSIVNLSIGNVIDSALFLSELDVDIVSLEATHEEHTQLGLHELVGHLLRLLLIESTDLLQRLVVGVGVRVLQQVEETLWVDTILLTNLLNGLGRIVNHEFGHFLASNLNISLITLLCEQFFLYHFLQDLLLHHSRVDLVVGVLLLLTRLRDVLELLHFNFLIANFGCQRVGSESTRSTHGLFKDKSE